MYIHTYIYIGLAKKFTWFFLTHMCYNFQTYVLGKTVLSLETRYIFSLTRSAKLIILASGLYHQEDGSQNSYPTFNSVGL